jgi:hypothetical protein
MSNQRVATRPKQADHVFDIPSFLRAHRKAGAVIIPYIGWLGHRNVGDDIVFDVLCHLVRMTLGKRSSAALSMVRAVSSGGAFRAFDWSTADGAVLGGGSTVDSFYVDKLRPAFELELPVFCFAAGFQKDSKVTPDEAASIKRLEAARFGSVRGVATRQILEEICGSVHVPTIVDGGYISPVFFNPFAMHRHAAEFVARSSQSGKRIVTVTILDLGYAINPLLEFMVAQASTYNYVLLPFDESTLAGLCKLQYAAALGCSVYLERDFTRYENLLSWYVVADFSVNMKLHASVLSSAVGTPPIGFGGGRKIDEYFGSIGSTTWRLTELNTQALFDKVEKIRHAKLTYLTDTPGQVAQILCAHLDSVEAFLATDTIAARLQALSGRPLSVIGVHAIDYGFIVIAAQPEMREETSPG